MGWWEFKYLLHNENPLVASTLWYGRCIDDLLFIVVADVATVQQFARYLNQNTCNLEFTVHRKTLSIPFLDMTLFPDGDKIITKSFNKSTAGKTVLHS